jgi:hypothetical protein
MKARILASFKPRTRKLFYWGLGLVLLYTVTGFLILPPIVRSVAVRQISKQLGREASIQQVKINPYAMSVAVRGLLIKDRDGEPFVSWDEVYVHFRLTSVFGPAWVFKEISVSKPFVRVQMNRDYTFNFSDILTRFATNAPAPPAAPAAPAQPVNVHVNRLHIGGASAALADFTPHQPFKRLVGPLDLTLDDFQTDPGNKNPYAFTGTTDAGETISWGGFFSLTPLRSEGELRLFNFALTKYAPLYQDLLRFEVRDGSIALRLKYRLALDATHRVTAVDDLACSLRHFRLGVAGDSNDLVSIPLFDVLGAYVDLQNHAATVDSVVLDGARAWVSRDTNAAVNVVELAKPAESATNAPGGILFLLRSVTNTVAMLLNSTNDWSGTVRDIAVTNCALHLEDHATPRPARLDLGEIALHAKNLSNLPGTNLEASLSLRWNTNAAIHISTSAGFQPVVADVHIDLDHLDLTTLDTYLASRVNLFILGSEVNLHGRVRLRTQTNDLPVVTFQGDASLEHFHAVDGMFGEDLVKWDALRFNGMDANLNPPQVTLREVVLDDVYARVILETNHTINLLNVLQPAQPDLTQATNLPIVPAAMANATATKTTNATNVSPPLPVQISIGAVVFTNTALQFSDRTIAPVVNLSVQALNGSIADLSTEQLQHARVNLSASVDGVGPVTITGTINPLNGGQTNTIHILVQDVDLTPTSPYSGKFAGYGIAEGKLNLDLQYELIGKNLKAKNVITLDQFTFGEPVNSPEATHLPVRLGVALLKDREGRIVLDVPVEGRLDDPQFRIGKVVTRAIVNLLEKVATSPFSLLGALIGGGGEELGWQEFAPGSAALTPDSAKKLDGLAKAMFARPGLQLEIAGDIDPQGDREGLQRAALDRQIRTRIWSQLRQSEQATNSVDQISLPPADRAQYLDQLLDEALAARRVPAELLVANTNLAAYAAAVTARTSTIKKGGEMLMARPTLAADSVPALGSKLVPPPSPAEVLLFTTIAVSDADLAALAASRAQAVQAYLVQTGKVEAGRLFLTAHGADTLRRNGSRTYLQFR